MENDIKYAYLLRSLTNDEYEALKESIRQYGLLDKIKKTKEGVILDGVHRLKICKELGIDAKFEIVDVKSELEEQLFVLEVNRHGRHFTPFEQVEAGLKAYELLQKKAEERREQTFPQDGQKGFQPVSLSKENDIEKGRSVEMISKTIGVSPATFMRAKVLVEKAPEPMKALVRTGVTSISKAYGEIKKQEKQNAKPTEPMVDVQKRAIQNLEASIKSQFTTLRGKFGDLIPHIKHPCETCPAELTCANILTEDEKFHESLPECMRKKLSKEE